MADATPIPQAFAHLAPRIEACQRLTHILLGLYIK